MDINALKNKILDGYNASDDEIYALAESNDIKALRDCSAEITRTFVKPVFDSCSIVNARSGRCSEDCKWCAQSAHHNTHCDTYPIIDREECLHAAHDNASKGVRRFSLVASGRSVKGETLSKMCDLLREIRKETDLSTCASMGLLGDTEMADLYDAGVRRYHCNLETAPSYFPHLCSTHSIEDKLRTIDSAHKVGMEVCSGGIIGMGETRRQRAEFALTLRRARPVSIPVNILSPIKGTPLEHTPAISDDEIIDFVAITRFAHPSVTIRFAGGRARLSRETQLELMRVGVNGGIVGDLLTTIGSTIAEDRNLSEAAGYKF